MWSLGKTLVAIETVDSPFPAKFRWILQDFTEIIITTNMFSSTVFIIIASVVQYNSYKYYNFSKVQSLLFLHSPFLSRTFSPLFPLRPRTPSAPCDARTDRSYTLIWCTFDKGGVLKLEISESLRDRRMLPVNATK